MANTTDFRRLTDIEKALNELIEDAHQLNTVFEMLKKHIPSKKEILEGNLFGKPITVSVPDRFINRIYDCQSSADSMLSLLQFYEGAIAERINDRGADKLMSDAKTLRRSINETLEQIRATLDTIISDMPKELMDLGETIRRVIQENAVYETELSFEKNLFYLGWKPVLSLTVKIEGAENEQGFKQPTIYLTAFWDLFNVYLDIAYCWYRPSVLLYQQVVGKTHFKDAIISTVKDAGFKILQSVPISKVLDKREREGLAEKLMQALGDSGSVCFGKTEILIDGIPGLMTQAFKENLARQLEGILKEYSTKQYTLTAAIGKKVRLSFRKI